MHDLTRRRFGLRQAAGDLVPDRAEDTGFHGLLGDAHGILDRLRVRAAVPDEDEAVHAEQWGRALFLGVEYFAEAAEGRADEHAAELGHEGAVLNLLFHDVEEQLRDGLRR